MAKLSFEGKSFIDNLPKIYGVYTGGFLAFFALMAFFETLGMSADIIGILFVAFTIAIYAFIGILSRTMQVEAYYVAGRQVPPVFNGMATAADWMSGASFVAMAGGIFMSGYGYLAFVVGWTGGYVLVATLMAPYLRKFGCYTVPDFIGTRYGGKTARLAAVLVLVVASFTYVTAQITATGTIAARALQIPFEVGVWFGLAGILVCSMLGGMRAVTWTQVAQYIVLIIAYLIPVVILSAQKTGVPIPQLMYGQVLQEIQHLEATKPALAGAKPFMATPANATEALNFFALILCLMVGTASLPHVLMRFFTTPSVKAARQSVGWALLFIFILYFTAPAYASFAKLEVYQNVLGAGVSTVEAVQQLFATSPWVRIYGDLGLVKLCGFTGDPTAGVMMTADAVFKACQGLNLTELTHSAFSIQSDVVVIATPEIAGLPYVIAGLVAAGGLAAALSTADGLLLAIANALSHDVYYRMVDPTATTHKRLVVARVLLVAVAVLGALVATTRPGGILALVAWAFSLAAAGLFPALVMGVWWKRTTKEGAIAGMLAGFGVTLFYLIMTRYGGMGEWFGVKNISAGLFGIPTAFLVTYVVSLMTPAPSKEMQDFIDAIRIPKGQTLMDEKT